VQRVEEVGQDRAQDGRVQRRLHPELEHVGERSRLRALEERPRGVLLVEVARDVPGIEHDHLAVLQDGDLVLAGGGDRLLVGEAPGMVSTSSPLCASAILMRQQ
jgi:hypothetical protein